MAASAQARTALGRYGEDVAARHLVAAGMAILERNWRCDLGEIDIVARSGRVLVFVEVKTRATTAFGTPAEAVTASKAARLRRLSARWLAEHPVSPAEVRIDVIGVVIPQRGGPQIDHLQAVA